MEGKPYKVSDGERHCAQNVYLKYFCARPFEELDKQPHLSTLVGWLQRLVTALFRSSKPLNELVVQNGAQASMIQPMHAGVSQHLSGGSSS